MLKVTASGQVLGATIEGLDLAQPLADDAYERVLRAGDAMIALLQRYDFKGGRNGIGRCLR